MSDPASPDALARGLLTRRVRVPKAKQAWLRFHLEAHEGLAIMLPPAADGTLVLVAPHCQQVALDTFLDDVLAELEGERA